MSLLMDALKRAETSKQQAARAITGSEPYAPPAEETIALEPFEKAPAVSGSRPLDLAINLEALDADLASTQFPREPPPAAPASLENAPRELAERDAVKNAFSAKLVGVPQSRLPFWVALGSLAVIATGIGSYFWYQLSALSQPPLMQPTATTSVAKPTLRPSPPAATDPTTAAAPQERSQPAYLPPPAATQAPVQIESRKPPSSAVAGSGTEMPIRLNRTPTPVDANLIRGHASIERSDLDQARRDFEATLQRDPNNSDALLALAAIAQRQGRSADGERLTQRAWVADPSDPSVQAAILNTPSATANPQNTESRLKSLISSQPESAPLNFALGNLYSRQNRWGEAQEAYFSAVAAEGDNPDYLFNLAVSLDHIRQSRLAAQHYRLALEAAGKRPAAFDSSQVRKRLAELQP